MFCLKGWILRRDETFMFASAIPITVTATRPASCSIWFDSTNTMMTDVSRTGTLRYSGIAPRGKAQAMAAAAT